ncbi:nucleoside-diphosphate kinase [Marinicellulosiphila megalodicopiae]|uniref:nucleoside-diphosphate kinase n=1 Tax=Marinicellulosiphila megalodicopiae TaxID=2724896 RepID=UPI003BB0F77A
MAIEKTLSIIKPNAVKQKHVGEIISMLEQNNLRISQMRMLQLDNVQAKMFYQEHIGKSFFDELLNFMLSGEIVVLKLEGENAIARYRELMGATNPCDAKEGSIREKFGDKTDLTQNAVHGSDSKESAKRELALFFK